MKPPSISTKPILKSTLPRRQWASTPETEEATIWLASVPTATGAGTPMKIRAGGHEKAAADPEHAGQEADHTAEAEQPEDVYRELGDGQVDLHGRPPYRLS